MSNRYASLIAVCALLMACPGNEHRDESRNAPAKTSATSSAPGNAQAVPENSTALNPVMPSRNDHAGARPPGSASAGIEIQLTEYEIRMADTIPSGKLTLSIANGGKEDHGLVIEGNGMHAALAEPLKRGDTGSLDVDLKPGTYDVFCPVDGHKGRGMERKITVK